MNELRIKDFAIGIISAVSWEVWENIFVAMIVALIGGFMAAAGRQAYLNFHKWRLKRKLRK